MAVDGTSRLRGLLALAEQRSTDQAAFATVSKVAEDDARWFLGEAVRIFAGKLISAETEADIERAMLGYIERRALALREGGAADTEVMAYIGAFALAFGAGHDEMQAEMRKAATVGTH